MMRKMTARKHVHALPSRNLVPTTSHSDGQNAGYLPRTLRTLLLALGYSEPPLIIGTPRLLHGKLYLWHTRVVIYKRPTTDRICCISHATPGLNKISGAPTCMPRYIHEVMSSMVINISEQISEYIALLHSLTSE
jgi:hypothetical protein